ncbi:MAG: protein phosphatase 2C domain-containing protein [Nitrospira sp.]|nr:protein phosphatase 2C domain-containing protein [Nitrospira sp.]
MNGWIGIGRSEVGLVRTVNQDAFTVVDQYGVWAVADGMGGHIGGDIAAQTAITTLKSHAASLNKSLCDGHPPTDLLTTLIGRAHEAILDRTRFTRN